MGYLRTNYRKDEPAKAKVKPTPSAPNPGAEFGVRNAEFENLALKNIAGSITVYRVTNDFIVGLEE